MLPPRTTTSKRRRCGERTPHCKAGSIRGQGRWDSTRKRCRPRDLPVLNSNWSCFSTTSSSRCAPETIDTPGRRFLRARGANFARTKFNRASKVCGKLPTREVRMACRQPRRSMRCGRSARSEICAQRSSGGRAHQLNVRGSSTTVDISEHPHYCPHYQRLRLRGPDTS